MPQMWHICATKVWDLCHKSGAFYYINVPQIVGGEKMCHIVALVWGKTEFRGHPTSLNREREIKVERKTD